MTLIVKLPMGMTVDVYNLPEDFEEQVQKAFGEFTTGTAKDYTYQDKLCFIDLAIKDLHGDRQSDKAVRKLMIDYFEAEIDEQGRIANEDDYYSIEFMEWCYQSGAESQKLHSSAFEGAKDYHDREKIEEMLIRFIKAVVEF
jgi:hypothetical protein